MENRLCLQCGSSLQHKRKDAKYCCVLCKQRANQNLISLTNYRNSIQGRSTGIWHNIKRRDPQTTLTKEWIIQRLTNGFCEVTGLPFVLDANANTSSSNMKPFSPSVDRKDSNLGYTKENSQLVVWIYNTAKNSFTHEDVLVLAEALLKADGSLKSQKSKRERKR